jgi:hypothetical protein
MITFAVSFTSYGQKDLKLKTTKLVSLQRFRSSKPSQFEMFWNEIVLNGSNFASNIENPALSLRLNFVIKYGSKIGF